MLPFDQLELWVKFIRDNRDDSTKTTMGWKNVRQIANSYFVNQRIPPVQIPPLSGLLDEFLKTRSRSGDRENILSGAFYINNGRIYFSINWWKAWLAERGYKPTQRQLTNTVQLRNGGKLFFNFKGTGEDGDNEGRNMWWVPNSQT